MGAQQKAVGRTYTTVLVITVIRPDLLSLALVHWLLTVFDLLEIRPLLAGGIHQAAGTSLLSERFCKV